MPRKSTKLVKVSAPEETIEPAPPVLGKVTDEPVVEPVELEPKPKKAKKTKYSFVVDDPEGLLPLINDAWNASKSVGDASFGDCQPAFKTDLLYHAQDVLRSGKASDSETPIAAFERKIHDIRAKQEA